MTFTDMYNQAKKGEHTELEQILTVKISNIEKLNQDYRTSLAFFEKDYETKKQSIKSLTHNNIISLLEKTLQKDSQLMEQENEFSPIDQETIESARKLYEYLENNPKEKEFMVSNLKDGEIKRMIEEDYFSPENQCITFYLAKNEKHCYLLTPTKPKSVAQLNRDLEMKLYEMFDKAIAQKIRMEVAKEEVKDTKLERIKIKTELEETPTGYTLWVLSNEQIQTEELKKYLLNRLTNPQLLPKEFKERGISHTIAEVPYSLINSYLQTKQTNIKKPVQLNNGIRQIRENQLIKKIEELNKNTGTPLSLKQLKKHLTDNEYHTAWRRLNKEKNPQYIKIINTN